jgi:hypothetical protein
MCDDVNLPAVLSRILKNQTEIAKSVRSLSFSIGLPSSDGFVNACMRTEADFAQFLSAYQIQVEKRSDKPRKCGP